MSEPGPVNLGGFGDIDMYPVETYEAALKIYQAGTAFRDAWLGHKALISAAEEQLGNGMDDLGVAFRANYNASAEVVTPAADKAGEIFQGFGEAGAKAVVTYLETDQQIVPERFRSMG